MGEVKAIPGRLDITARAGDSRQIQLTWPAGALAGTGPWTATATADGQTPLILAVLVAGDVLTITVPVPSGWLHEVGQWTLTDGLTGNEQIAGTFRVTDQAGPSTLTATVQIVNQTVAVTVLSDTAAAQVAIHGSDRVLHGVRAELPAARVAKAPIVRARNAGLDATIVVLGDSISEGWGPSHLNMRWSDQLARLLNGDGPQGATYEKTSANLLSDLDDPDWPAPSMNNPWSFTGTAVGSGTYGMELNSALISSGGSASLAYAGDQVSIIYTRQPAGGTHQIFIDGVQLATLNTLGTELVGQRATYGTAGDYGPHVLTVQVGAQAAGPLLLEGALVHDGNPELFGGIRQATVNVLNACHTLFGVLNFANGSNWDKSLAARAPHLVAVALGWNDLHILGTSLSAYQVGLGTIMTKIDAAMTAAGFVLPAYLLLPMPGLTASWRQANWTAALAHDPARCAVLDLAHFLGRGDPDETTSWTIFDPLGNPDHPNNAGSDWIARQVADLLDPGGPRPTRTKPSTVTIGALDIPTRRSNWAESLVTTVGSMNSPALVRDVSPVGSTIGERRHRVWLEAGVYQLWLQYRRNTGTGICEALVGFPAQSAGTIATAGTDNTLVTQFPSTVTVPYSGWWPVVIRKTASPGSVSFVDLTLRRTS